AVACSHSSGSVFPIGQSTVTCSATDDAGNTAATSFTITVRDSQAPLLVGLPGDIDVEVDGRTAATVSFDTPVSHDTVDSNPAVSCAPASGSVFPYGSTVV